MTQNSQITLTGFVATDPVFFEEVDDKKAFIDFRFGSTPRKYDRSKSEWIDGETTWFNVNAYGALAKNLSKCVDKGANLLISGVLTTKKWEDQEGNEHSSNVVKATSIGFNLNFGTAEFTRSNSSDEDLAEIVESATDPETKDISKKKR